MKPITIFVSRFGDSPFVTESLGCFSGTDRVRTIERAMHHVPDAERASLRKALREVVEGVAQPDERGILYSHVNLNRGVVEIPDGGGLNGPKHKVVWPPFGFTVYECEVVS